MAYVSRACTSCLIVSLEREPLRATRLLLMRRARIVSIPRHRLVHLRQERAHEAVARRRSPISWFAHFRVPNVTLFHNNSSSLHFAQFASIGVLCAIAAIGCQQGTPTTTASSSPWGATPAANSANQQQMDMMQQMWNQQSAQLQATTSAMQQRQRDLLRQQQEQARLAEQRKGEDLDRQAQLARLREGDEDAIGTMRRQVMDLNANNVDLHTQLAQSQQETRLMEDRLQLLNKRLGDTANQLEVALRGQEVSKKKIEVLEASTRRKGSATIKANSSTAKTLTTISIPGVLVRQDGDVVRLELPSDQVFMPQSATPNPAATELLNRVAQAIAEKYPRQIIGVEGHTDSDPVSNSAWRSNHQLSAAQALAIMDLLAQNRALSARQLSQAGHGPNYPVASNATPQGKARNRRVEIVVYPETVDVR